MRVYFQLVILGILALVVNANASLKMKGFNLTTPMNTPSVYDAAEEGQPKTAAQQAVDYIKSIGGNHVTLVPEARMLNGTTTTITPVTPAGKERSEERKRYSRLIKYIKSQGMTVGIRPILTVVNQGTDKALIWPGTETKDVNGKIIAGSGLKVWHGNIKPQNPAAWFDSYRAYLDIYVNIGKSAGIDDFTIGAELYSMTIGTEDLWKEYPYGFPKEFGVLFKDFKAKLGPSVKLTYDMNYTDTKSNKDGTGATGGEMERWRYRLVDLSPENAKKANLKSYSKADWETVRDLWDAIDIIGMDVYPSLAVKGQAIPTKYEDLVKKLTEKMEMFASDIDTKLSDIESVTNPKNDAKKHKQVIFKEVGFRSCTNCFIDSFEYDDAEKKPNTDHQAAAYQAFFDSFVKPDFEWLYGVTFWDVSVDPARSGEKDAGFSPRGKTRTEKVIKSSW